MDLLIIYRYAYWGVIHEIKTITSLYNMCVEVGDGDAAEEYENLLEDLKSDFNYIISALGYDKESSWQVLTYELKKENNYEGR